ncbi:hypothetical protein [Pontiella sulfatireligans]|uniref:Uncharacterized protein n=1 Tax=Pontiella sulfatireligans TaxID=2750658 RepID=A0A6C2UTD9_9BACT|nr:hypothetical protein [Pontiella sulfatireligans]VGO23419.1 hypothetical protein SCARR_05526 [Pontiella sulfatireligans]
MQAIDWPVEALRAPPIQPIEPTSHGCHPQASLLLPPALAAHPAPICGFLLCLAVVSVAEDAGKPVTLELAERRPLEQDCYGANCLLIGRPVWYNHPDFVAKYNEAGKPFFRFPGGTPANYYNPETGLRDEVAASGRDYAFGNKKGLKETAGWGQRPDGFFEFAKTSGARYSVVLNVCTRTVEQNREWLSVVAKQGIEIPCFEIGNELYFGTYAWAFKTPQNYLKRAKETTAMIRRIFPKAKVGVVVPSHLYTHESFLEEKQPTKENRPQEWMDMLEGGRFFDAVVIHLYSQTGMDSKVEAKDFLPFAESFGNAVDYVDEHLAPALDALESKFPGKEIWITEYGVGGFSGDLRKYGLRFSHLGVLHSDLMLLRFLSRPSVKISSWHSFSHFLEYDEKNGGLGKKTHLSFLHFTLFADAVRNSQLYVPLKVGGGATVEAGAFIGREKSYAVVINKRAESCSFGGLKSQKPMRLAGALQLSPRKDLLLEEALQDTTWISKTELTGKALDAIQFPPYSITRLEFVWE